MPGPVATNFTWPWTVQEGKLGRSARRYCELVLDLLNMQSNGHAEQKVEVRPTRPDKK